jgi:hypothetical protein
MKKYEYKWVYTLKEVNRLALEGWRVIGITNDPTMLMEKEIDESVPTGRV